MNSIAALTFVMSALLDGLVWSVLWTALLMPMLFHFPWLLVHDYPEDVRKAVRLPEPTSAQRRNGIILIIFTYVLLLGTLMAAGLQVRYRLALCSCTCGLSA